MVEKGLDPDCGADESHLSEYESESSEEEDGSSKKKIVDEDEKGLQLKEPCPCDWAAMKCLHPCLTPNWCNYLDCNRKVHHQCQIAWEQGEMWNDFAIDKSCRYQRLNLFSILICE